MSRIFQILSTKGDGRIELDTNAETWGQLQSEIVEDGRLNAADCTAMIGGSRELLESADAVLPAGGGIIYITPTKVKSGK